MSEDALIHCVRVPKSGSKSLLLMLGEAFAGRRVFYLPDTLRPETALSPWQRLRLWRSQRQNLMQKLGTPSLSAAFARIEAEHAEEKVKVIEAGGLFVLGTERHESRRIDNQLRGRSGRQGDPGRSSFFLSLEDDLMRLFGSDRIGRLMDTLGAQEGEVLTHPLITRMRHQGIDGRKRAGPSSD